MSEPPRRSKRAHPAAEPELLSAAQDADEEAAEDEEEVTRCLCGQQEYPGPPLSEAYGASEAQADDAGGLFIQCDGCSVWQHGGCVGIFDEAQSPDKYYCEDCRPKQHEVHVDTKGYVALFSPRFFTCMPQFGGRHCMVSRVAASGANSSRLQAVT